MVSDNLRCGRARGGKPHRLGRYISHFPGHREQIRPAYSQVRSPRVSLKSIPKRLPKRYPLSPDSKGAILVPLAPSWHVSSKWMSWERQATT